MPRISVLLPVRNGAATLEPSLKSILEERALPLEVVVVDDGSTDETPALLHALAKEDPRVRVVRGPARGLPAALNVGLAECRAPFIARMDADDLSLPGRLSSSLDRLEGAPHLLGVGCQVEAFREDRPVSPAMQAYVRWLGSLTSPERLRRERFIESPLCHPSVTLRADRLRAAGGWSDGDFPEDYELWLRLLSGGGALECLPRVLLRWRDTDARATRMDPRYSLARHAALKARFLARDFLSRGHCAVWGAGATGLRIARLLRAEGVEVPLLVDVHPRKVGSVIDGARVVAPEAVPRAGERQVVAAVGAFGVREEIRRFLGARGYVEGEHYVCAA